MLLLLEIDSFELVFLDHQEKNEGLPNMRTPKAEKPKMRYRNYCMKIVVNTSKYQLGTCEESLLNKVLNFKNKNKKERKNKEMMKNLFLQNLSIIT